MLTIFHYVTVDAVAYFDIIVIFIDITRHADYARRAIRHDCY